MVVARSDADQECLVSWQAASGRLRKLGSWQELLPPPPAAGEEGGAAAGAPGFAQRRAQELDVRRSTSLGDAGSSHGVEQQQAFPSAQEEPALRKQASGSRKRKLHCEPQEAAGAVEGGGAEAAAQAAAGSPDAPALA